MTTTLQQIKPCTPAQVDSAKGHILLLDVRTPVEFRGSHIAGSLLQPLGELRPAEVGQLMKGKEACVVVCGSGKRARQAAGKLQQAGLDPVQVLEGGIQAWEAAGLPLIRGKKAISLERQVRIAAGMLVLTGVFLAWLVHPTWIALSGIVGAGLIFAGISDTCGMALLLARMPWNK
ncbi:MAG: rhodanese-like domain-containing protein [Methylacidiphilales bacterium]|nr:rhodanese-like domain-containing protein [Candidatus Methylacidiphilales bacterium]